MAPFTARLFLACGLLVALGYGCAHRGGADDAERSAPGTAVGAEDIQATPSQPIEQLLMSRFPGIVVTRTAGGIAVRLRSATSFQGSDRPLYVVDDVPTEPGSDGTLFGVNPYDIESIEVLKDAAGTTRYGMRGGNGVIIIKTKQREDEDDPEQSLPHRTTVTAEDIQRTPGQSIEALLMTRFPSVLVVRAPDGGIAVRIRGATSIYGSNEPLYVIDGLPIKPGPGGSLSGINPYDIDSIEVLTDPVSTTMYGVRGANGIIVIKTKQPDQ